MRKDSERLSGEIAEKFYKLAKEYDVLDSDIMNPSLHELSSLKERYSSPELIAEGGMKRVCKVYDSVLKRDVAMATLHEDAPDDLADLLIHEAWLTSQLEHPNIIAVYDVGVLRENRPFFTMDLKHGVNLSEYFETDSAFREQKTEQAFLNDALRIFLKICEAISYAHSNNVVHLDLKPANIQIGDYGRVVVCDWGLSVVLGAQDNLQFDRLLFNPDLLGHQTLYGQIKGTPGYMAPEQIECGKAVDQRTDIYGLGGILYKILTDSAPLTGEAEEILARCKAGEITPPHKLEVSRPVPEALSAVAMKALSVNPDDRYQSVDDLHSEISRYLQGFPTKAENAGLLREIRLFYLRNQRFCILAAIFTLLLFISSALFSGQLIEKERVASAARATAEKNLALYQAGQSELQEVSLENINSVIQLASQAFQEGTYGRAISILESANEAKPDSGELARALGLQLFTMQRFNEARPWLAMGLYSNDIFEDLAAKYGKIKHDDQVLAVSEVKELVGHLEKNQTLALELVLYDQGRRFNLVERAEVIEAFLRLINPGWDDGWFEYDPERNRLKVGGENLTRISYVRSLIRGLRLRELDISDSEISELWAENDLPIEVLNISNTNISYSEVGKAWFLKRMLHLRQLILSEGQLDVREMKRLLPGVEIITRPSSEYNLNR